MTMYAQNELIGRYLTSRGVVGFRFGGGSSGVTGPEIVIEGCTTEMSQKLQDACSDALISHGGGGLAGSYAYRQIHPEAFSDPLDRARDMLTAFEANGELPFPNTFNLRIDDDSNLVGFSGAVVYKADDRTRAMQAWVLANHGTMMQQAERLEKESSRPARMRM